MKICKKCGEIASYNSHLKAYYCSCCGHLEVVTTQPVERSCEHYGTPSCKGILKDEALRR